MSWRLPHLPTPDSFFQRGQKHTISNFGWGKSPPCFETGGAYAPSAVRLRTPLACYSTFPPCIFSREALCYEPKSSDDFLLKNLVWNKKSSLDWGHNRGQEYPKTCFQGQYIGWKSILIPEKIGFIDY